MMINAGDTITQDQYKSESLKLSEALKKDDQYDIATDSEGEEVK